MRTFFCIPVCEQHRDTFGRTAGRIRSMTSMRASWVPRENYHITLRFLGDIDASIIPDLDELSRVLSARVSPFDCLLDRIGAFPSIDRARVLWVGGLIPISFERLARALSAGLADLGFPRAKKDSVVHVTLARIKDKPDPGLADAIERISPIRPVSLTVDRIVLMESTLSAQGSVYTPLFTKRLGETS